MQISLLIHSILLKYGVIIMVIFRMRKFQYFLLFQELLFLAFIFQIKAFNIIS